MGLRGEARKGVRSGGGRGSGLLGWRRGMDRSDWSARHLPRPTRPIDERVVFTSRTFLRPDEPLSSPGWSSPWVRTAVHLPRSSLPQYELSLHRRIGATWDYRHVRVASRTFGIFQPWLSHAWTIWKVLLSFDFSYQPRFGVLPPKEWLRGAEVSSHGTLRSSVYCPRLFGARAKPALPSSPA